MKSITVTYIVFFMGAQVIEFSKHYVYSEFFRLCIFSYNTRNG